MSDDDMRATWRLVNGDQTIMAMPRMAFLRAIMLNHWYHHRGQLSVYLRQLGRPAAVDLRAERGRKPIRHTGGRCHGLKSAVRDLVTAHESPSPMRLG
jgi:hypothetical protein